MQQNGLMYSSKSVLKLKDLDLLDVCIWNIMLFVYTEYVCVCMLLTGRIVVTWVSHIHMVRGIRVYDRSQENKRLSVYIDFSSDPFFLAAGRTLKKCCLLIFANPLGNTLLVGN